MANVASRTYLAAILRRAQARQDPWAQSCSASLRSSRAAWRAPLIVLAVSIVCLMLSFVGPVGPCGPSTLVGWVLMLIGMFGVPIGICWSAVQLLRKGL